VAQTFRLHVADVPATARGGVLYFGVEGNEARPLTAELRGGTLDFLFSFGSTLLATPEVGLNPGLPAATASPGAGPNPGQPAAAAPVGWAQSAIALVGTRTEALPVLAVGPVSAAEPVGARESGGTTTPASARNGTRENAISSISGDLSPKEPDPQIPDLLRKW